MSEGSEIHIDENDSAGKKIGVLAAMLAILLSIFTINAHRAHTETIELQNDANDQWSHYQSKRIREYQLEMNSDLVKIMPAPSADKTALINAYTNKHNEYDKELTEIKTDADAITQRNLLVQKKALHYDFAEGILEISLIMSSLYFISRKNLFPLLGIIFGILGTAIGVYGLLL